MDIASIFGYALGILIILGVLTLIIRIIVAVGTSHKIIKIVILVFILIIAGRIIFIEFQAKTEAESMIDAKPDYTMSIEDFYRVYNENALGADQKYEDKVIQLAGRIIEIYRDNHGDACIDIQVIDQDFWGELSDALDSNAGIKCKFSDETEIKDVKMGDVVIVKGKASSSEEAKDRGYAFLRYCVIVDSEEFVTESTNQQTQTIHQTQIAQQSPNYSTNTNGATFDENSAEDIVVAWLNNNPFPYDYGFMDSYEQTINGKDYYCFELFEDMPDKIMNIVTICVEKETNELYAYDPIFDDIQKLDDWYDDYFGY